MSIIEVAKIAGVSKTTVSRVINNDKTVTPETIKLVCDAMKAVDYKIPKNRRGPKRTASATTSTGSVAVIVLGYNFAQIYAEGSGLAVVLHGLECALSESNLRMIISTLETPSEDAQVSITSNNVEGIVIIGRNESLPASLKLLLERVPAVRLSTGWPELPKDCDTISFNNHLIGEMAANYLQQNGHQNVACLSPYPNHLIHNKRIEEFMKKASELDMNAQRFVCTEQEAPPPSPTIEHTHKLIQKLLREKYRPTGIFITNSIRAVHAYNALKLNGIEPMKDIDIVTATKLDFHIQQMTPSPAIIDTKLELIGEKAVEHLLWRIQHPYETGRINITIDPFLYVK